MSMMSLENLRGAVLRPAVVLVAAFLAVGLTGCGRSRMGTGTNAPAAEAKPTIESDAQLKERLEYIANSGAAGSALGGLPEFIEKHAKQKELMAEFKKLQAATTPDQIKSIAKAMLGKL